MLVSMKHLSAATRLREVHIFRTLMKDFIARADYPRGLLRFVLCGISASGLASIRRFSAWRRRAASKTCSQHLLEQTVAGKLEGVDGAFEAFEKLCPDQGNDLLLPPLLPALLVQRTGYQHQLIG